MAGLGAMFIGMIGGGIAWICMIVSIWILAAIIFIDAHRHGLRAWLWALMALLFNFYSLPFYIYVRVKKAILKCPSCGTKVGEKKNFCPECGTEIQKIDDGAIAKKILKYALIVIAIFSIIGIAYIAIDGIVNY